MPKPIRRVNTGHDNAGKAVVIADGHAPLDKHRGDAPGHAH
jgi:hypothetical protein